MITMGFKLIAAAIASCAFIGVAIGVGLTQASLVISIGRNPSQRDELLRYSFIGFSLVEVSGLIGLVGFTNATPQRKVLFIDRLTGQDNNFEGVITKVIYDQTINSTSIKTSLMETSIETRILKVGDLVIVKEDQILYKGSR